MPACLYLCGDAGTDVSPASSVSAAEPCAFAARAGGLASRSQQSIPGEPGRL